MSDLGRHARININRINQVLIDAVIALVWVFVETTGPGTRACGLFGFPILRFLKKILIHVGLVLAI